MEPVPTAPGYEPDLRPWQPTKPHLDGCGAFRDLPEQGVDRREVKRTLGLAKVSDELLRCPRCGGPAHGLHANVLRKLGLRVTAPCMSTESAAAVSARSPGRARTDTRTTTAGLTFSGLILPRSPELAAEGRPADAPVERLLLPPERQPAPVTRAYSLPLRQRSSTTAGQRRPRAHQPTEPPPPPTVVRVDLESASHGELRDALLLCGRALEGRLRQEADRHGGLREWLQATEAVATGAFRGSVDELLAHPGCGRWAQRQLGQARRQLIQEAPVWGRRRQRTPPPAHRRPSRPS
eukprot:TRINITY_DN71325_c0_g1_i1.p2 TRINITY_DN71325_c0_g1~~TRINITY_DN71325_c0_g1_i1.p2  ORF type:complete len:294 (+),score=70.65 TRINITY_DN71325_c0_g1_i1:83-964(+)